LRSLAFRNFLQQGARCRRAGCPGEAAQRGWRKFLKAPKGAACAAPLRRYFACKGQPAFTCAKSLAVAPHRLRRDHNQFLEVPFNYKMELGGEPENFRFGDRVGWHCFFNDSLFALWMVNLK